VLRRGEADRAALAEPTPLRLEVPGEQLYTLIYIVSRRVRRQLDPLTPEARLLGRIDRALEAPDDASLRWYAARVCYPEESFTIELERDEAAAAVALLHARPDLRHLRHSRSLTDRIESLLAGDDGARG